MIVLNNVSKTYHLGTTMVRALRGVSISIDRGDFICMMGPSGSGKSTLLNIIGCLDRPDSGEVAIDGEAVASLDRNSLADIRAHKIGFIFQMFNLIPVLNVYENIEFPLFIKKEKISEIEKRRRIEHLIEVVGLTEAVKHRPDELSGGQRQRVAIARALVTRPSIILADEPTANLDSETAQSILAVMKRLNTEEKVTFVFATHDPNISTFATSIHRLKDGLLVS